MKSCVIQLIGSPASGKSTAAAHLYTALKCMGIDTELSLEYIKPLVYKGIKITPYTQYYIFGHEIEQQASLFNKVSCIISDSSPLLASFYQWYYTKKNTLAEACRDFYKTAEEKNDVQFLNFFLPHREDYNPNGRIQDKEGALEVERLLRAYLEVENYPFQELKCSDKDRINIILEKIKEMTGDFNGMAVA